LASTIKPDESHSTTLESDQSAEIASTRRKYAEELVDIVMRAGTVSLQSRPEDRQRAADAHFLGAR
jgi:hypothetical protein